MREHPLDRLARKYRTAILIVGGISLFPAAYFQARMLILYAQNSPWYATATACAFMFMAVIGLASLFDSLREEGK